MSKKNRRNGKVHYYAPKVNHPDAKTFAFNFKDYPLKNYISDEEKDLFINEVLCPLVSKLINSENEIVFPVDQDKNWLLKLVEVFPKFKNIAEAQNFISQIMGMAYTQLEEQAQRLKLNIKKEIDELKAEAKIDISDTPEAITFLNNCKQIFKYTQAKGKDYFDEGLPVGKYIIDIISDEEKLECNTYFSVINLPDLKTTFHDGIHHIFLHNQTEPEKIKSLLEETNQSLKNNFKKYITPAIFKPFLNLETRNKLMVNLMGDKCPDYLEISRDGTKIINWSLRIWCLDMEAKQATEYQGIKKLTANVYADWMTKTAEEYKEGKRGKRLIDAYKPNDILDRQSTNEQKPWHEWYKQIVKMSHAGGTGGTLDDFFRSLKKHSGYISVDGKAKGKLYPHF